MGVKISIADEFYDRCCREYTLRYRDPGKFAQTSLGRISSYQIEGVGHVTLARTSALFVTREGCVFAPDGKDAPILMVDRVKKPGSDTLTINIVKSQLSPITYRQFEKLEESFEKLEDADAPEVWYSAELIRGSVAKKAGAEELAGLLEEYMDAYLRIVEFAEKCDPAAKAEKNAAFAHGLLEKGGLAADKIRKTLGENGAKDFFDTVVFPQK